MKTFILTGAKFDGSISLEYNSQGQLVCWNIKEADLNASQFEFVMSNIPIEERWIDHFKKKGCNIQEIAPDLSFEAFWKAYDNKVSKKDAERAWNKLSKNNRALALEHIPKYNRYLAKNRIQKAYPATYLNKERWLDQY